MFIGILLMTIVAAPIQSGSVPKPDRQTTSVSLPPASPTVPPDVMYAFGQQNTQLGAILGRLQRIEDQMTDLNRDARALQADAARANTIISLVGWALATAVGVLIANWVRDWWSRRKNSLVKWLRLDSPANRVS